MGHNEQEEILQSINKYSQVFNAMVQDILTKQASDDGDLANANSVFSPNKLISLMSDKVEIDSAKLLQSQFTFMEQQSALWQQASMAMMGETEDTDRFRAFYDEYMAVLDIPAEFYLETIERIFKNNELANGTITYQGKPVDFTAIDNTALLTVEGADDDICGLKQTEAAQDICKNVPKNMRKHHVQQGAGHYGIFSGSKFRKHIRPLVTEFIHKYDNS